jgi:hypothetical protein
MAGEPNSEPLTVPFDVSLTPSMLETDDCANQNDALQAALDADSPRLDDTDTFNDAPVMTKTLSWFRDMYKSKNKRIAFELLQKRVQLELDDRLLTVPTDSMDLTWNATQHYLDMLVCVPRGLGLGALIPNRRRLHTFEFTLNLSQQYRTFSAKYTKLGFDPTGRMLWIGRSPSSEDVWITWVPNDWLSPATEIEDVAIGVCTGSTELDTRRYRLSVMFLASMLHSIGTRDLTVQTPYPGLDNANAFQQASNIL